MKVDMITLKRCIRLDLCQSTYLRNQPNQPLKGFIVKFSEWVKLIFFIGNWKEAVYNYSMTSINVPYMTKPANWRSYRDIDKDLNLVSAYSSLVYTFFHKRLVYKRLSLKLSTRTAHPFACSAILALLVCSIAFIRSLARSLTWSLTHSLTWERDSCLRIEFVDFIQFQPIVIWCYVECRCTQHEAQFLGHF